MESFMIDMHDGKQPIEILARRIPDGVLLWQVAKPIPMEEWIRIPEDGNPYAPSTEMEFVELKMKTIGFDGSVRRFGYCNAWHCWIYSEWGKVNVD